MSRRGRTPHRQLPGCRRAATAIEYVLIAGGIAVAVLAAVLLLGGELRLYFEAIADGITGRQIL